MDRIHQSLDVLKASPVRGQLEPYDSRTPKGSRYIQTTDTYDELKVLLPPGTAAMYEQLLKLENYELSKKTSVSWERIMEIRHLKDRMIRKCQKLAKTTMPTAKKSSRVDSFVFQTFVAPHDFRLKEMEKWFRDQQKRPSPVARHASASAHSAGHEMSLVGLSSQWHASSSKHTMQRSITNPESSSKQKQALMQKSLPAIQPSRLIQSERPPSAPVVAPLYPTIVNEIFSPPPLPVLILGNREEYGLDSRQTDEVQHFEETSGGLVIIAGDPQNDLQARDIEESSSRPTLRRRPSSLKRVSWADSQQWDNQVTQYASAAREAQASGKWDQVHTLYLEQIAGLENLHLQVKEGLDHLRSETDHLQRIDETIRKQREALNATFQDFEQKHIIFQEKVQEALTEASDALTRPRRELEPINES